MSHLKASGDRDRWACRLPLARQLGQPGLVVRSEQLLITSLPRRRHMTREDWQVLDALQAACAWHADRMPEYAWLYPDYEHRRPIEITAPDPAWLARWRHDHVTAAIEMGARATVDGPGSPSPIKTVNMAA